MNIGTEVASLQMINITRGFIKIKRNVFYNTGLKSIAILPTKNKMGFKLVPHFIVIPELVDAYVIYHSVLKPFQVYLGYYLENHEYSMKEYISRSEIMEYANTNPYGERLSGKGVRNLFVKTFYEVFGVLLSFAQYRHVSSESITHVIY